MTAGMEHTMKLIDIRRFIFGGTDEIPVMGVCRVRAFYHNGCTTVIASGNFTQAGELDEFAGMNLMITDGIEDIARRVVTELNIDFDQIIEHYPPHDGYDEYFGIVRFLEFATERGHFAYPDWYPLTRLQVSERIGQPLD
jgi:hypothetical protein